MLMTVAGRLRFLFCSHHNADSCDAAAEEVVGQDLLPSMHDYL